MKNVKLKPIISNNKIIKKRKKKIIANKYYTRLEVSYKVTDVNQGLFRKEKILIVVKRLKKR